MHTLLKPHLLISIPPCPLCVQFDAEFRRISVERSAMKQFGDLHEVLQRLHLLQEIAFTISYSDPKDGYLLPINNDDNFAKAVECARPLLRIFLQRKGELEWSHASSPVLPPVTAMLCWCFLPPVEGFCGRYRITREGEQASFCASHVSDDLVFFFSFSASAMYARCGV